MTIRTFQLGDRVRLTDHKPGEAEGTITEIGLIRHPDGGRSYRIAFDDDIESQLWWNWWHIEAAT